MPDYRIKISETKDEDREYHHYLVTAKDEEDLKTLLVVLRERIENKK